MLNLVRGLLKLALWLFAFLLVVGAILKIFSTIRTFHY